MDVVLRMCSVCFRMRPKLNEEVVEVAGSWKPDCSGGKEQRGPGEQEVGSQFWRLVRSTHTGSWRFEW
jgi:hypothetical protein